MKQLTQQLKSGKMEIVEVPNPVLNKSQVLVRNHYSLVSAGTEGKTVFDARKGYVAKARSRQKEVKMVIDLVKSQGIRATYDLVMNKLEAPSPLGYSCAGEVIAVAEDIHDLKPGDFVACGGQGAYHSEIVAVYRNLCVKIPSNIDLKHAAFTTVASIALQGIRQADLQTGGNCVVIGLGLIGQLTCQLLNASGVKSIGIDIDDAQVKATRASGAAWAWSRNQEGLEQLVLGATNAHGADAVIITAGTSSLDPVELAGELCRHKGKVVIVGAVPTGFTRANYYKKELDLRMSSSYGPGRYDPAYEEKGIDYPVGYVRWTENRNMQAFVDLLAAGRLNIDKLISHVFDLEKSPEAYELILSKKEPYSGVLIRYDINRDLIKSSVELNIIPAKQDFPSVGFIGAGNFAQNILLPRLKGLVNFTGIATAHGTTSLYVGKKYGFSYCTSETDKILSDNRINTVFIATRHNLHAPVVIDALKAGKNVFVEKPFTINLEELEKIRESYYTLAEKPLLMVGYNRRFAPYTNRILQLLQPDQPKGINIRVNAGAVPADHWVNDPEVGGGRIIGEGCHFVDLAVWLAGSPVVSVSASEVKSRQNLMDSFIATLRFRNGSAASITYLSNGNKDVPKELVEVFCDGTVSRIDDFRKFEFFGKRSFRSGSSQDKGHTNELKAFTEAISKGLPSPIPFEQLYHTSLVTFKIIESIQTGRTIYIDHAF
jgi:predicted dehydrogenase/threonine dehydrogenase-like Zn-dependent dehydrogenase